MFKYKLYSRERCDAADLVTSDNWLDVLHSDDPPEQLDLWMERESLPIEVTPDSDDDSVKLRGIRSRDQPIPATNAAASPVPFEPGTMNRPLGHTTSSTLLMVPTASTHRRNFSGSSAGSSTTSHVTIRQLSVFIPFLQWPFEDSTTKPGDQTHYERTKLWLDNILARVGKSYIDDMDLDLQALAKPIVAKSIQRASRSSSRMSAPISGSTRIEVQRRLQSAASKSPVSTSPSPSGLSQDVSLQQLRKLVEDIQANTDKNDLDALAWERAFRALQEYYNLPEQNDVARAVMSPMFQHFNASHLDLQAMDRDEIESKFRHSSGQQIVEPLSNRELDAVFAKGKHLLALFTPEKLYSAGIEGDGSWNSTEHPLVRLYWGLHDRIVQVCLLVRTSKYQLNVPQEIVERRLHATDLTNLLKALTDIVGLAELLHKGVRKRKTSLVSNNERENIDSLVIQSPIPDALEHTLYFLFDVVKYISTRSADDPPGNFSWAVGKRLKDVEDALKLAQKYLIEEADQSALDAGLGPVVTPEAITLLLLERLSRGVYKNGFINVLEVYEKIVEKLVSLFPSLSEFLAGSQGLTRSQNRLHRLKAKQVDTYCWS